MGRGAVRDAFRRFGGSGCRVLAGGCAGIVPRPGWRGLGRSGIGSGGGEDFARGLALAGGAVPLRLRLVREAPAQADDRDGGVGQAGEVARRFAVAHAGAVLVPGPVADVVEPVFDLPVAPVQGGDFRGVGAPVCVIEHRRSLTPPAPNFQRGKLPAALQWGNDDFKMALSGAALVFEMCRDVRYSRCRKQRHWADMLSRRTML